MHVVATTAGSRCTFTRRIATTVEISRNVVSFPRIEGGKSRMPSARNMTRQMARAKASRKTVSTRSQTGMWRDVGVEGSAKTTVSYTHLRAHETDSYLV